ncbi:hypothetical protein [Nonomuraea sp. NEAU-A123]|uniref:hypothetical protein n=1 Tax=Nonomuraea sp. NEAU-A123 TaxID=2839649 RepID=UPI001BE48913|nr:hypothetical protein [Nonomuraea sp. NEAU-A123]MBT2231683.1 hypothetical protein [Nonomuraea sp. NEAU-A123]
MKVCFHGTAEELELVAGRPLMVLLTSRDLPRLRVFALLQARTLKHPYNGLFRLCADLAEDKGSGHD